MRAQSRHCGRGTCGQSGPSCNWSAARATWAMFNLAIDSKLSGCDPVALRVGDVTWHRTGKRSTDQLSAEENGSARPLRADRGHTPGAGRLPAGERPESGAIVVSGPTCRGSVADDAPICSAAFPMDQRRWLGPAQVRDPIPCAGPRPRSSTGARGTQARCNFCSHTGASRAPCATSASRSTMPSILQRGSTSELPGQSCRALPSGWLGSMTGRRPTSQSIFEYCGSAIAPGSIRGAA